MHASEESAQPATPDRTPRTWLVAGLGNPGPEYELTPHNLGFMVVDRLAEANGVRVTRKEAMALVGRGEVSGCPVWLAKPQTYMNHSGLSVRALMERLALTPENLILVYDELALPWTALRIRPRGSAGGHNGVASVIESLATEKFVRVRLGIHPGHPVADGAGFVLQPMKRAQYKDLDELLDYGARAVESIIAEGVEKSMTKINRRAQGSNTEEA